MAKLEFTTFDVDGAALANAWQTQHRFAGMTVDEFKHAAELHYAMTRAGWTWIGYPSAEGVRVRFCDTYVTNTFDLPAQNIHDMLAAAHTRIFGGKKSS